MIHLAFNSKHSINILTWTFIQFLFWTMRGLFSNVGWNIPGVFHKCYCAPWGLITRYHSTQTYTHSKFHPNRMRTYSLTNRTISIPTQYFEKKLAESYSLCALSQFLVRKVSIITIWTVISVVRPYVLPNQRIRNQQIWLNSLGMTPSPDVDQNHSRGAFSACACSFLYNVST